MENIYSRRKALEAKINNVLSEITNIKKDYMKGFTAQDFFKLKSALSDINNVLTLETTLSFAYWLKDFYKFTEDEFDKIIKQVQSTKPNTNGFDIKIETNNRKILAEIKCLVPVNNSNKFGAAQRNSLLDDAVNLIDGKRGLINTSEYHKFIGIIDTGQNTDEAIIDLTNHVNSRSKSPKQIRRNEIIDLIQYMEDTNLVNINPENIELGKVYIKRIKIDTPNILYHK